MLLITVLVQKSHELFFCIFSMKSNVARNWLLVCSAQHLRLQSALSPSEPVIC